MTIVEMANVTAIKNYLDIRVSRNITKSESKQPNSTTLSLLITFYGKNNIDNYIVS